MMSAVMSGEAGGDTYFYVVRDELRCARGLCVAAVLHGVLHICHLCCIVTIHTGKGGGDKTSELLPTYLPTYLSTYLR